MILFYDDVLYIFKKETWFPKLLVHLFSIRKKYIKFILERSANKKYNNNNRKSADSYAKAQEASYFEIYIYIYICVNLM